jgi:FixJ family two-component response regulator
VRRLDEGGVVHVVDDDEAVRDSIGALLGASRLRVRGHGSCGSFIEDRDRPDAACLLLDLHMPRMGGLEFMERHRGDLRGLPVVVMTGRGDPATLGRALALGASAVLEKPFEEDALLDALARFAGLRPGTGGSRAVP